MNLPPPMLPEAPLDDRIAKQIRARFRLAGYSSLMVELRIALIRWRQAQELKLTAETASVEVGPDRKS